MRTFRPCRTTPKQRDNTFENWSEFIMMATWDRSELISRFLIYTLRVINVFKFLNVQSKSIVVEEQNLKEQRRHDLKKT